MQIVISSAMTDSGARVPQHIGYSGTTSGRAEVPFPEARTTQTAQKQTASQTTNARAEVSYPEVSYLTQNYPETSTEASAYMSDNNSTKGYKDHEGGGCPFPN